MSHTARQPNFYEEGGGDNGSEDQVEEAEEQEQIRQGPVVAEPVEWPPPPCSVPTPHTMAMAGEEKRTLSLGRVD